MRVILLLLAGAVCAGMTAEAQAETLLHLSETATIMVPPDELAASLRAEAILPTAAAAQARVNDVMREALSAARAVPGTTVSTGGYSVWRVAPTAQDKSERWQAGQTLNLSGTDGVAILKVVERLQQKGLAVGNLGWRLSRPAERKAHQEATRQALLALRGRIDDAAGVLGLRFEQFKQVRLVAPQPQPPMLRAMAAPTAMSSGAPPSAAPEDIAVNANRGRRRDPAADVTQSGKRRPDRLERHRASVAAEAARASAMISAGRRGKAQRTCREEWGDSKSRRGMAVQTGCWKKERRPPGAPFAEVRRSQPDQPG